MNAADDDAIKTTLEWPFYAKLNIHAEVCTRAGESSQFHKFRAQLVGCDGVSFWMGITPHHSLKWTRIEDEAEYRVNGVSVKRLDAGKKKPLDSWI